MRADPGQIEQVILNIALNARDAMPNGGQLTIETSGAEITQASGRERSGPPRASMLCCRWPTPESGMDSDVQSRVFEPFFTTKEHGTGLGLSTSYGIIRQTRRRHLGGFQTRAKALPSEFICRSPSKSPRKLADAAIQPAASRQRDDSVG